VSIQIIKDRWERLVNPDSAGSVAPHKHCFKRVGPNRPFAHVQASRKGHSGTDLHMQSGFRNLEILKTTQSGFEGFHRNRLTSLPEAADRLLATSMNAEWEFTPLLNLSAEGLRRALRTNYNKVLLTCRRQLPRPDVITVK